LNDKQDASTVDSIYSFKFLKKLLDDSESLDIEIPSDSFDSVKLRQDLNIYNTWKSKAEHVIKKLKSELHKKSDLALQGDTMSQFLAIKEEVSQCPVYNSELFMKIQAFDWVYNVCRLLNKQT